MTAICEPLNFVIVGHVDHGKSTVIGRLLADTDSLPEGKLEQVKNYCAQHSRPFEYAFLLDTLKDEQAQGITIDTTRIFFRSKKRRYMILDAPGHIEFLKNMVTGAAKANAALLVIDAKEGVKENSRRHGLLLSLLGIEQVVVLVNKMDLVGYSESVFSQIQSEYAAYLEQLKVKAKAFIPISAFQGENLCRRSEKMPWYKGEDVLSLIDSFEAPRAHSDLPFRMPLQDVYKFTKNNDDRRILVGTAASGSLRVGDTVVFSPSGKKSKVTSFENFSAVQPQQIEPGQAVGFCLADQIYVKRGEVAYKAGDTPPLAASKILATLFWLGKKPMAVGKRYLLKVGTARCEAELVEIRKTVNTQDLTLSSKQSVEANEVTDCVFDLDHPIPFDFSLPDLSRFVLFEDFEAAGGGITRELLNDPHLAWKDEVTTREAKWDSGSVLSGERENRNGHPGFLLLVTGPKETHRKEVAKAVERKLFDLGHATYYLGFGNVLHGIASHIERKQQEEQIHLAAEASKLFLEAGFILVMSIQDLSQEDFQRIRVALRGRISKTVWLGQNAEGDLRPDWCFAPEHESELVNKIVEQLGSVNLLRNLT